VNGFHVRRRRSAGRALGRYPRSLDDALDRVYRHSGAHQLAQLRSGSRQGGGACTPPSGQGLCLRMAAREQGRYALPALCWRVVPVTTGPQDAALAGRDRVRAGHADREQVIETLKTAFVHGQLTKDELDARVGQALTARTCADLAVLTAEIPPGPAAARPTRPPSPARPLSRAAAVAGGCLVIAVVAVWEAFVLDSGGPGPNPYHSRAKPFLVVALAAVLAAFGILAIGVATSLGRDGRPAPAGVRAL
jgi:Domain of unknown function (DUF1707)